MKTETPVKEELITEAALRRFTHFGFNKTTFSEIAKDLGISQQSLYYYFPDKKSLIAKVASNVMTALLEEIRISIATRQNLEDKLSGIVEVKQTFFEKYFMLATDRPLDKTPEPDDLKNFVEQMETKQLEIMVEALNEAAAKKEICHGDTVKTARLLLKALTAMQEAYRSSHIIPDHNTIRELFEEQKELIRIFVFGLKYRAVSNHQ
ncbi:MAG: TetR/AcrR family transcriptional regulator [Chitinophagaceae bacterium]|nr:TetR/AcrR family transcriptional regulator [Chitinophagaceae bacterium]MCW5928091.1 TetR/AcrR family transcriptional regulator [Chitinophagaceae bacterium]